MSRTTWVYRLLAIAATAAWLPVPSLASAAGAGWQPSRPVRLVLPFAPGGAADVVARVLTPKFHEALGQPWVLDNRGGAGGTIAAEIVARANPDGHTVFLGISTAVTVSPLLHKLPFDVAKDLIPVSMVTAGQYMLVLHPSVKADNLREFIALARGKPGGINYASSGVGGPSHMSAELFSARAGIRMTNVPYKGGGPATNAILAGEVHALFVSLVSAVPHVKTGRLKALAVTGPRRAAVAPEIPTVAELGFPGFEVTTWYGLFVPGKTPDQIVTTLQAAAANVINMPDVKEVIARQGLEVAFKGAKEFADHMRNETKVWTTLIRNAKIKAE